MSKDSFGVLDEWELISIDVQIAGLRVFYTLEYEVDVKMEFINFCDEDFVNLLDKRIRE